MASNEFIIKGTKAKRGERMTGGAGWVLGTTKGNRRVFRGTLLTTVNNGKERLAIFRVPK